MTGGPVRMVLPVSRGCERGGGGRRLTAQEPLTLQKRFREARGPTHTPYIHIHTDRTRVCVCVREREGERE